MMEYDFRTTLMIISAIAIIAILFHGLWKIRKNKNPYKLKAKVATEPSIDNSDEIDRNFDGSGFDKDGVSQPRVIRANGVSEDINHQSGYETHFNESSVKENNTKGEPFFSQDPSIQSESSEHHHEDPVPVAKKPVYETPISSPKPDLERHVNRKVQTIAVDKNTPIDNEPFISDDTESSLDKKVVDINPEVLVLSILMPEGTLMSGAVLLPSLLTLGMKYGDMNIFHRHEDNAGNGQVTFSLANMMNPGTFDLDTMENFSTQGVSLFMTLPNSNDGFKVFEQMLSAAKQLSQEFNAQLLDDKRNIITKQTEQHYIGRIREFDRKYRIAASELN